MTSQTDQKRGKPFFALRGSPRLTAFSLFCLFLAAILLIHPAPASAAGEDAASAAPAMPCKGLKPYNNIDELLFQIHANLDSDCLFTMPVEELEKIWDTKIASYEVEDSSAIKMAASFGFDREELINYETTRKLSAPLDAKPYNAERDAFYIVAAKSDELYTVSFYIKMTREYAKKNGTLFPDSNSPQGLPDPIMTCYATKHWDSFGSPPAAPKPGKFSDNTTHHHFWVNADGTRIIEADGSGGGVNWLEVHNFIPEYWIDIIKREKRVSPWNGKLCQ
ncbi:MAG: hypothetical protein LBV79_02280 [Candidatus Adiutrix sp.]|jgi:hypothetical protein|nr:hypothetical protein [Candidatus Adiutrix sp.]